MCLCEFRRQLRVLRAHGSHAGIRLGSLVLQANKLLLDAFDLRSKGLALLTLLFVTAVATYWCALLLGDTKARRSVRVSPTLLAVAGPLRRGPGQRLFQSL